MKPDRVTLLAAQVARPGTNKSDEVLFYSLLIKGIC
jgi:hypothetical protein